MKWSRVVPACALAVSLGALGCGPGDDDPATSTTAASSGAEVGSNASSSAASGASASSDSGSSASVDDAAVSSGAAGPELSCTSVDECRLYADCCSCVAIHRDQPPPEDCLGDCDRDACDFMGISELVCSHSCHIALVECDPAMVTCDAPAPMCPEGYVPSLEERCWSGHCVLPELCRP